MLTDHEAHDLLHEAAATIEVPARTVAPPRRRAWPVLVAVAAAVVAVAGVGVALRPDASAPRPRGPADNSTSTTAEPSLTGVAFRLGPDQVPSVVGLTAEAAERLLVRDGYVVTVRDEPSCGAGQAVGTDPSVGAIIEPGAAVTLLRGDGSRRCLAGSVPDHGLLDFLLSGGPAPRFADEVGIYTGDGAPRVVSGEEAADAATWPRRDVIEAVRSSVVYADGEFHPVDINVGDDPGDFSCGRTEGPSGLTDRGTAVILAPWHLGPTPLRGGCVDLGIHQDDDGAITAVEVDAQGGAFGTAPSEAPPSVLGNSEAFARARVAASGYRARFVDITDCAPVGIVSRMMGAIDFYPGDLLTFGVTTRTGACAGEDWVDSIPPRGGTDGVADSFLAFARGGPEPAWADEVTLYVADETMGVVEAPGDHPAWGFCLSPDELPSGRDCLAGNVLDVVAGDGVTAADGFATGPCLFHSSASLNDFTTPAATLRGPGGCSFAVEIWTDEAGAISGVDYLYDRDERLPGACTETDHVRITDGGSEGAGATLLHYWHLAADRPCTLRGYPTATLYDDAGTALDIPASRSGRDAETMLVGGDLDPAVVLGTSRCDTTVDPDRAAAVRVELPGGAGMVTADASVPYCPDEGQHLTIEPVESWQ
ncbi:PASTA domain-containing protein [Nocardioides sp. MH1]|uniref:PASTA domain-containing protein n=1 Tax=Nocardioides sp. MH1 TaxID=3242490 RepID=UPI00351FFCC1